MCPWGQPTASPECDQPEIRLKKLVQGSDLGDVWFSRLRILQGSRFSASRRDPADRVGASDIGPPRNPKA